MISSKPCFFSSSIRYSITGRFRMGTKGFGTLRVRGSRREPTPAASIIAFMRVLLGYLGSYDGAQTECWRGMRDSSAIIGKRALALYETGCARLPNTQDTHKARQLRLSRIENTRKRDSQRAKAAVKI